MTPTPPPADQERDAPAFLTNDQAREIEDRLLLFRDHIEGKKVALIDRKPYSDQTAMDLNMVTLLIESLPALLADHKARAAREAELLGKVRDAEKALAFLSSEAALFKTPSSEPVTGDFSPAGMWKDIAKGMQDYARQALSRLSKLPPVRMTNDQAVLALSTIYLLACLFAARKVSDLALLYAAAMLCWVALSLLSNVLPFCR